MKIRFVLSMVLVLVIIAGAIGLGTYAYNAGMAQGLAQSGRIAAPDGVAVAPYYSPYIYHPFNFGFGGFLFSCFFIFLIFGLVRAIFGHRHWGMHGRRGMWNGDFPPMAAEWHRKMHDNKSNEV
jgi:hypothetical protein